MRVEKRTVNSYPEFFGEVGGLSEFLISCASVLIVTTQGGSFYLHMIRSLFHTRVDDTDTGPETLMARSKKFKPGKYSCNQRLKIQYWMCIWCCSNKRDKKMNSLFARGRQKIDKELDTKRLVRSLRAFRTLLRLEYGKNSRKLLYFQRRHTILELPAKDEKVEVGHESSSTGGSEIDTTLRKLHHSRQQ